MFCVHIVRDKDAILVSLVNQRNDFIHALCIRWHIEPFIELIKRAFGAEQVELAVGADLGKFEQSFGVRDRSYSSTESVKIVNYLQRNKWVIFVKLDECRKQTDQRNAFI